MATVKRILDLTTYATVLPYASEMFGVYQPLLGWKSKRIQERFNKGLQHDKPFLIEKLKTEFAGMVNITYNENNQINIDIKPGELETGKMRSFDSIVLQQVSHRLPPYSKYNSDIWSQIINRDYIDHILKSDVVKVYEEIHYNLFKESPGLSTGYLMRYNPAGENASADIRSAKIGAYEHQLQYESSVAGALLYLVEHKKYNILQEIFYTKKNNAEKAIQLIKILSSEDSSESYFDISHLDPRDKDQLSRVALSPIGVVHLFRQYFFELDTFLGTPVSHVWLSPGSTTELIEIHTRKTVIEKTLENTLETFMRAEKSTTEQDEISDAVKENNQQDVKFGASVTASYASVSATSSFDYNNSQQQARETTHKRMRQQTEKLSSEIRKNFKSTFKTISEFTDVASTKHVLANSTDELINYELRRKMRQVGVQVQDIGTYLCWQTYVDDPGKELGLAKLIHIAKKAELDGIPHPEEIPMLQSFMEEKTVTIPFISVEGNADNEDEVYKDGVEVDDSEWFGELEKIQADFAQEFVCPKANYELTNVEFDPMGKPVHVSRKGGINNGGNKATFTLHLDSADFQGQNSLQVKVILHWSPKAGANDDIIQKNKDNLANFKEREKAEYERAFIENVKDRVDISSRITRRNSDELREEERIVVYRRLIQDMLMNGIPMPDDSTRHVVAELINSIFDVDKMLYFVAPEWWRPRLHRSKQQLQETPPQVKYDPSAVVAGSFTSVLQRRLLKKFNFAEINATTQVVNANTVGWGGIDDPARDNYFITGDSEPAKLGSSLGWLLQLDGDNMRNALLNAPWVKAVIPIRPGKEEAAINWLKGVEGMNGITDDVIYHANSPDEKDINGNPLEGQRMIDVLMDLAKKIKKKHEDGMKTDSYPKPGEISDPELVDESTTVTSTPIDRVYEHGFFPLENSFKFNVDKNYEIFDQWIEILPTDQIVPVEVKYDPKTGRQL